MALHHNIFLRTDGPQFRSSLADITLIVATASLAPSNSLCTCLPRLACTIPCDLNGPRRDGRKLTLQLHQMRRRLLLTTL